MKKLIVFSLVLLILLSGCKKETPVSAQTVTTTEVTAVTDVTDVTDVTESTTVTEPTVEPTEKTEVTNLNLGQFMLTAYCPCSACCGKSDGITATGTTATQGRTIAVDPRVIPYGTEVIINGHTYIAEDCGGSINGNRIDVYFDSHSEALQFGVQYADVYIVRS